MKQKMVEAEQEERRKVLGREGKEKEKEMLDEHYKTKMTKKIVERADEDEELVLDEDEEQKMRRYRRKEDGIDGSDQDDETKDISPHRSRQEYERSRSRSGSREQTRRPYSRDQSWSPDSNAGSDSDKKKTSFGKTRLRKKVADGSDVEEGC